MNQPDQKSPVLPIYTTEMYSKRSQEWHPFGKFAGKTFTEALTFAKLIKKEYPKYQIRLKVVEYIEVAE